MNSCRPRSTCSSRRAPSSTPTSWCSPKQVPVPRARRAGQRYRRRPAPTGRRCDHRATRHRQRGAAGRRNRNCGSTPTPSRARRCSGQTAAAPRRAAASQAHQQTTERRGGAAKVGCPCPLRAPRGCPTSTRRPIFCVRAGERHSGPWWPACAASPTMSAISCPTRRWWRRSVMSASTPPGSTWSRSMPSWARSTAVATSIAASVPPLAGCVRAGSTSPPPCDAARRCHRSTSCASARSTSSAMGTTGSPWPARSGALKSTPTSPRSSPGSVPSAPSPWTRCRSRATNGSSSSACRCPTTPEWRSNSPTRGTTAAWPRPSRPGGFGSARIAESRSAGARWPTCGWRTSTAR